MQAFPFIIIGGVILFGFLLGELAKEIKLPKVTGYIIAGVLLNPQICTFLPTNFADRTDVVTNIALSFITFSIGGTLLYSRLKKLGKGIIYVTLFEAEVAYLAIFVGLIAVLPFLVHIPGTTMFATFIPAGLLIGALGSPTDPSVALAIKAEYHPKGEVMDTMLSVAAFDDVLGIINYSLAIVIAAIFITHQKFNIYSTLLNPAMIIVGSLLLGIAFGIIFNFITKLLKKETESALAVIVFGLLTLGFGIATLIEVDQLLTLMTMGIVVVNFNPKQEKIFKILERYIEELVFVLFFTLSALHLNFSILKTAWIFILFFIIFRVIGKFAGTFIGAAIANSSAKVKKYTAGGLIPQGGIVLGLALMMQQNPAFDKISDIIISVVLGATVINEFIGPILIKIALKGAGEIKK